LPITEACEAAKRWRTGSGASAQNDVSTGVVEGRRRTVGGVGCFTGVRAAFYTGRGEARGQGAFNGRR
jgi:hypothetical protein